MNRRPTPKSLESLSVTLQKLEQTVDPGMDDASISQLKRVVLNRIVDLELSKTLETSEDETDQAPEPTDWAQLPTMTTEEAPSQEAADKTDQNKLD